MGRLKKILIIGGDERQNFIFNNLKSKGFDISLCGLGGLNENSRCCLSFDDYDILVLPMPITKDSVAVNSPFSSEKYYLKDFFNLKDKTVFGGMFGTNFPKSFFENNRIYDYSKSENLIMYNAILTAEAAVAIAIKNSKRSLAFSNSLIIGNGRIGKSLSHILLGFYTNITVSARRDADFNSIKAQGLNSIHTDNIGKIISKFDYIFNTVPSPVLTEKVIKTVNPDCLIIDLASMPGGTDFEACKNLGIHAEHSLSLPGKFSPVSAANAITDEIEKIIAQRLE